MHCESSTQYGRSGISLLEVLVSMFVLTIGLLSLASMVPVGQFQVREAANADAAVATGRAALREFKAMDMLDSGYWVRRQGGNPFSTTGNPKITDGESFILDPLLLSPDPTLSKYDFFPPKSAVPNPVFPYLPRVTLGDVASGSYIGQTQADLIFRGTDDKEYELPKDTSQRPLLVNSGGGAQSQSRGDYSWLAMVSPLVYLNGSPVKANSWRKLCLVDFVVFYKRDTNVDLTANAPSERFVFVDMLGGGDVQLRVPYSTTGEVKGIAAGQTTDAKEYLKVRPEQWILLAAQTSATPGPSIAVHRWYRIVATGELQDTGTEWVREVTLAGPDVNITQFIDVDLTSSTTFYGVLCDGVIGVFQKTVQLDEPSLWTAH